MASRSTDQSFNRTHNGGFAGQLSEPDNLLSKYKKVSQANENKLRAAKNIKELVKIEIEKLPEAIRLQSDGGYDMKFDPINFR